MTTPTAPDSASPTPPPASDADTADARRDRPWQWLAAAVGFLAPLSFNIGYFLREDKKRTFVAGMDLVVLLLLAIACANGRRIPALLRALPKTLLLFVAFTAVAYGATVLVGTHSLHDLLDFKLEFLKVWLGNYLEYLLLAPLLVAFLIDGKTERLKFLVRGLILAGLIAAAAGCWDFWNPKLLDVEVAGLYDHRNLLGGAMALLVPIAAAAMVFDSCRYTQAAAGVLVILGLWCQTTAGALLGIVGGVFAVAAVAWSLRARFHRCTFKILTLAALMVIVPVVSNLLSPRAASSADFTDAQVAAHYRGYTLQPRSQLDAALESIAPWKVEDPTDAKSSHTRLSDRARRWQAQINLIRKEPFGCGTGLYQKDIGNFYGGAYSKPAVRTDVHEAWGAEADEPGSVGMYEVIASETGLLGLALFLAVLIAALARSGAQLLNGATAITAPGETGATATTSPTADAPTAMRGHGHTKVVIPFEVLAGMLAFGALAGAALAGIFLDPIAARGPAGVAAIALGLTVSLRASRATKAAADA